MKRILLFAAYFWPHKGGHEKYAQEVCSRLVDKDTKVDVITASIDGAPDEEFICKMRVIRVPTWHILGGTFPVPKPGVWPQLKELGKYDVVMTHTRFFPLSFVGALYAKRNNIPHIHIEHGTTHTGSKPFVFAVNWLYDHTFGYLVMRWATVVAGISQASRRFVNHLHARETVFLPNAVDARFFKPVKIQSPYQGKKVITFIGRLIAAKGVQDLIEATKDIQSVQVLIIGKGNYDETLKKLAVQNAAFLGEKNSEEIREILSYTDIFVNPSYAEGLPTSVLEAGSMGVPVIATNVGGTSEIIDDASKGILIEPRDVKALKHSIQSLLKNPAKAKKMAIKLQKRVDELYDWTETARKAEELIDALSKTV